MKKSYIYPFVLIGLLAGCEINQKDVKPEDQFLKLYNHPAENLSFYPVSLVQLIDGGYMFVNSVKDEQAEVEYPFANVVRTTCTGEVLWTRAYEWLAPVPGMFKAGDMAGFVAMDGQFGAYALIIDPADGKISQQYGLETTMPLAVFSDRNERLVVLGYDYLNRASSISVFSQDFVLQRSVNLNINDDQEYLVQRHLNRSGQSYPFFINEFEREGTFGYAINCFYNYTLRTVFLNESSLTLLGDIYSFQTEEAISSLVYLYENRFGLTSYYEGNNFLVSETELDVTTSQNIRDVPAIPLYELTRKATVRAASIPFDGKDYSLFVSQTNSNSVITYQYEEASDSLVKTHYETFDERVEVADLIPTDDGGIAILGSIYIMGEFRRPFLIKTPESKYLIE